MFPTPQAHDATAGNPNRVGRFGTKHGGRNLNDEIMMAAPQARDYRTGSLARWQDARKGIRSCNLNDQIGGQLNPTWVEWLMGYPLGWTDLNASETP
jgi:hypothetical protein